MITRHETSCIRVDRYAARNLFRDRSTSNLLDTTACMSRLRLVEVMRKGEKGGCDVSGLRDIWLSPVG